MLPTVNALTLIYGKHKNLEDCSENKYESVTFQKQWCDGCHCL